MGQQSVINVRINEQDIRLSFDNDDASEWDDIDTPVFTPGSGVTPLWWPEVDWGAESGPGSSSSPGLRTHLPSPHHSQRSPQVASWRSWILEMWTELYAVMDIIGILNSRDVYRIIRSKHWSGIIGILSTRVVDRNMRCYCCALSYV